VPPTNEIHPAVDVLILNPIKSSLEELQLENKRLKSELEQFRNWMKLAPGLEIIPTDQVIIQVNQTQPPQQQQQNSHSKQNKPCRTTAKAPKASKKETEKGMWCTRCESCSTTAQFTTDLKPCGACKKLCHFNDDLNSCYHWDCEVCDKKICKECNKLHGGNKMHPLCSQECAKKYKAKRT
jgi:hypothetical protein